MIPTKQARAILRGFGFVKSLQHSMSILHATDVHMHAATGVLLFLMLDVCEQGATAVTVHFSNLKCCLSAPQGQHHLLSYLRQTEKPAGCHQTV